MHTRHLEKRCFWQRSPPVRFGKTPLFLYPLCCLEILRIVIPSKIGGLPVNEIGREAFAVKNIANAPDIEQIMIPDSVKKIGDRAFSRSEVRNIIFGNGVKSIPKEAFLLCSLSHLRADRLFCLG